MMTKKLDLSRGDDMVLWYRQPAAEWFEALPIGNGHFGGMVFGGVFAERIQLNEDRLWSGHPFLGHDVMQASERYLPEIRRLIMEENDYYRSEELADKMQGPLNQSYLPLGDLYLISTTPARRASTGVNWTWIKRSFASSMRFAVRRTPVRSLPAPLIR